MLYFAGVSPRVLAEGATSWPYHWRTGETNSFATNGVFSQEKQCSVCLQAMSSIIPMPGLQLQVQLQDKQVTPFCVHTKEPMALFHQISTK